MAFKPQERAKAISEGKSKYFTGRPCKYGHVAERRVNGGACLVCEAEKYKNWAASNPEKVKAAYSKSYAKHAEHRRQKAAEYRANNPEKIAAATRGWRENNRGKRTSMQMMRLARQANATPSWLSPEQKESIDVFYTEAASLSKKFNVRIHVDHIVPLKGSNVCGLHVPWNLQLTTQSYNCSKNNSMTELPQTITKPYNILAHKSALPWNLKEMAQ
jgi:hypothetical protein